VLLCSGLSSNSTLETDRFYVRASSLREYEKPQANGASELGDEIKIASVIEGSAGKFKEWVVAPASNLKDYRKLCVMIDERYDRQKTYIAPAATYHSDNHGGDMDVDAAGKSKGEGEGERKGSGKTKDEGEDKTKTKGEDKDGGKAKAKSVPKDSFACYFGHCGKWGRRRK
jgi:hypothetical protein